jgi:DnaJ-class molecular chaperone
MTPTDTTDEQSHEALFMTELLDSINPRACEVCLGTGQGWYLGWSQGYEDCETCDGTGFRAEQS